MKYCIGTAWAVAALPKRFCASIAAAGLLAAACGGAQAQGAYGFSPAVATGGSQSQTVTVTVQNAGTVSAVNVLTQGLAGLDFTLDTSSTPANACSTQFYAQGATCNVQVKFSPQYPGARQGAVTLTAAGGALGTTYLSGTGQGALQVMAPGVIDTFAGDGAWTYDGKEGKPATGAALFLPMGGQFDAAGNFYIADSQNNRVRMVDTAGNIYTVAGDGTPGYSGDGGVATAAEISQPSAVVVDGAGNLYISDCGNQVIRRVDAVTHFISTVAGQPGQPWFHGDGGLASASYLDHPEGLALDGAGNLYVTDAWNSEVRKIDVQSGTITAFAGTGTGGYSGEGLAAVSSMLNAPWGIAFGPDGGLYIADLNNNRIRKVDAVTGQMTTVAGTGKADFAGDQGPATAADLNSPGAVVLDPAGNIYIADSSNNRVRKVIAETGIIETIVGADPDSAVGDNEPSTSGGLYGPYGLALDGKGNLYIADMFHNLVRKVNSSLVTLTYSTIRQGRTSAPQTETIENDGNSSLTISALNLVSNAALDPNAKQPCSANQVMQMGDTCNLGVEFLPAVTGNPVTGQMTVETTAFNSPATINLTGQVLSVDPTQTTLSANPNPAALGASVTFTASVTWTNTGTVIPSGTVQFLDGTTVLGQSTLSAQAVASFSTTSLALGSHNITAVYGGDDNNYTSTSAVVTEVVKQVTATALSSSVNPANAGIPVTFTATVTTTSGTPSGTVSFKDGGTTLNSATLSGGVAAFTTSSLSVAQHTITAVYSGDSVNEGSTSAALTQKVQLGSTTTALSASANNVVAGTAVTLSVQVTSTGVAPTGTVKFYDGTAFVGQGTLNGAGQTSMATTTLTVATHDLTAIYQGDTNSAQSTSADVQETIDQISTTTTLSASASPTPAGAKLTLTATVTPSASTGGTISGTVTFKDGTQVLGTGTVDGGTGVASASLTTLGVGPHSLVATYGGATNFAASSSSAFAETVQQATTTTVVTASVNPLTAGKTVTFTATVSGNGGTPTGTVTFKDGTATLGSSAMTNGVASYVASALPAGGHSITAVYAGDANDVGSTSAALTETVQQATTGVGLITSLNPVIAGKTVTFTATVTGNGATPGGPVTFMDGTTALQTVAVNAQGVASLTTGALAVGGHSITAVYGGDANDAGSTSAALTETVQQATTQTTVSVSPNPVAQGALVSFTATVMGNGAQPAGTVQFLDGATLLGAGTLNGAGAASFSSSALLFGTHSITAVYVGDANDGGSTSAVVLLKVLPTTTMSLTANVNPVPAGAAVMFTAAVSGQGSVPTGTVTFKDGAAVLGTTAVDGSGRASLSTTALTIGTHSVTASYAGDAANASSVSQPVSEQVVQATTTAQLSTSAQVAAAGSKVTLTATVSGNGGVPTGQVTFKDGATALGTSTLNAQGLATLATSSLSVNTHMVTAVYAGDTDDAGSTSAAVTVVVQLAPTQVSVSSDTDPSTATVAVTLRAVVKSDGDTPTGQVVWKDGGTVIGTTVLDGTGATALTISTLTVGPHSVTASYLGDANNAASASDAMVQTVQAATSGVVLISSANPSVYQSAVLLTATVTAASGTPSGTVQFVDGTTVLGSGAVNGSGMATLNVSTLAIGAHSIVAAYSGDANHSASQSAALAQNVLQQTATGLTASANPAVASTSLRLTATVAGQNGVAVTGTVVFKEGATVLGTGTLNGAGVATFNISTLAVGQHLIVALYSGDAKNQASSSVVLSETVAAANTQVALTASANPLTAGSALTLTATVTGAGGALTGSVTFADGSTALATVPLNAGGVATLTTSTLTPGPHTITATYSGDGDNSTSSSPALNESVLQTTAVKLSSALNPSLALDPVVLTATVNNGASTPATGTVTFTDGTTVLGTAAMTNGAAVLTVPSLIVGQHPIVASYGGDAYDFSGSSAALTQVIQLRPTTDTLTATSSAQGGGQQVTLISVVRWTGAVVPTGTVTFVNGSTQIGTAPVDGTGVATLTVVLSNGAASVVATYSGDASYAGSTSSPASLPGDQPTMFTMTADANAATVASQQFTVIHLTLTSLQGYTDTMKLGCLGLPYAATCTFSSDSVSLTANGKQTVTLTLDTGTPLTAGGEAKNESGRRSPLALALLLPGGLLLGFAGWRGRRRLSGVVLLLIVGLALTAGITGCSSSLQINGTPPGSYAVKLTATGNGSGITQTMNFNLTVQ